MINPPRTRPRRIDIRDNGGAATSNTSCAILPRLQSKIQRGRRIMTETALTGALEQMFWTGSIYPHLIGYQVRHPLFTGPPAEGGTP